MASTLVKDLIGLLPRTKVRNGIIIAFTSLILGSNTGFAISSNNQTNKEPKSLHSLPINKPSSYSAMTLEKLLPMPTSDVNDAAATVDSLKNPFRSIDAGFSGGATGLPQGLQFTGVAQASNSSVVAMIVTAIGQEAYEVGDVIGNGFKITSISIDDTTVDISNGSKDYRLSIER